MTDPDTPDWLPPLACALMFVFAAWAVAPYLAELVGAWRAGAESAGGLLADGGVE